MLYTLDVYKEWWVLYVHLGSDCHSLVNKGPEHEYGVRAVNVAKVCAKISARLNEHPIKVRHYDTKPYSYG